VLASTKTVSPGLVRLLRPPAPIRSRPYSYSPGAHTGCTAKRMCKLYTYYRLVSFNWVGVHSLIVRHHHHHHHYRCWQSLITDDDKVGESGKVSQSSWILSAL